MDTPKVFKEHYPDPGKNLVSFCIVGVAGCTLGDDEARNAMGAAISKDFPDLDHNFVDVDIMEEKDGDKVVFTFTAWTKRVPDTYERKSGVPTTLMNGYSLTLPPKMGMPTEADMARHADA